MSLIERIDESLLRRFDRIVGWSRDRGSADQWQFAHGCLDISLALLVASFVTDAWEQDSFDLGRQMSYGLLFFVFGFLRGREKRSIGTLASSHTGAMQARMGEAGLRQINLMIMAGLMLLSLPSHAPSDLLFIVSVAIFDATLYFKAAEPPPPARRRDELAHQGG